MTKTSVKILHIMPQIGIGGAELQLYALIVGSDPAEVTHEVLYYSDSKDQKGFQLYDHAGITYRRIPRNKKRPFKFLKEFSHEIKQRNPDIVHCWLWSGNIWGRWAAIRADIKHIIVAYRNTAMAYPKCSWFFERIAGQKVHYLANSSAVAQEVGKVIGVSSDKFQVIYNGVDLDRFTMASNKDKWLKKLNLASNTWLITMTGRLTVQKNYPMLLKTAALCKQKGLPVHFLIVGHGELEAELKAYSQALKLTDTVTFLGLRMDVPEILKSSDIFCYTSNHEGFPNVLLEAMAAGLPVITTNISCVEEFIDDQKNGQIIPLDAAQLAYQSLRKYIEQPEWSQGCANQANKTVTERFSLKRMVQTTLGFYRNILNG
jgi:glycosyltransferase involved in cell wall biosynthesis